MWHSRQGSGNTFLHISLFTMDDYSDKTGLYGVVSDGHIFGLFVSLRPALLLGFPQEANISLEAAVGPIGYLSAVFVVFHSRYQSTFIPVPPSIRPM